MPQARVVPTLDDVLARLESLATPKDLGNYERFGIAATNPLGVSMANIQKVAKGVGRDHALAAALWDTDIYEARLLAAYVDDPAAVTVAQMDRWACDFDNWGVCDTLCVALFDRTPHACDVSIPGPPQSPSSSAAPRSR